MPEAAQRARDHTEFGRKALAELTPEETIGAQAGEVDEGEGTFTLLFESVLSGYPGWRWAVTIAQLEGAEPTLLETQLVPGDGALLAPEWTPWSERMEDYRAAQLALGESTADDEDDDDDDDDDDDFGSGVLHGGDLDGVDIDEVDPAEVDEAEADASAVSSVGVEKADEAEADAGGTSKKPPRQPRVRQRTGKKKQDDKGD